MNKLWAGLLMVFLALAIDNPHWVGAWAGEAYKGFIMELMR